MVTHAMYVAEDFRSLFLDLLFISSDTLLQPAEGCTGCLCGGCHRCHAVRHQLERIRVGLEDSNGTRVETRSKTDEFFLWRLPGLDVCVREPIMDPGLASTLLSRAAYAHSREQTDTTQRVQGAVLAVEGRAWVLGSMSDTSLQQYVPLPGQLQRPCGDHQRGSPGHPVRHSSV
jgi:hypothetical protein